MTSNRRTLLRTLAGASAAVAWGGRDAWSAEPPLRIGYSTSLTGVSAAYARSQINGLQLAIDEANAGGGILGRQVELLVRDNQLKPDLGIAQTRDLITREKVDFLIGAPGSQIVLATTLVAKQYKKVTMYAMAATPRLTMELFQPYMFNIISTAMMDARAAAEEVGAKFKKFAFIGADYEASHQYDKYFRERVQKLNPGAEWVAEAWPKLGETDFSPYIQQLLAAKPDIVVTNIYGPDLIAFVKQARPYGFFDQVKFSVALNMDDLRALGNDLPDGVLGEMHAAFWIGGPRMPGFVERFRKKYNDYPAEFAIFGYEAMESLLQGITKAGTTESDAVVKALEELQYDGLRGRLSFRALDHQANVPSFVGVTGPSKLLPFKVITDVQVIPGELTLPSVEEIQAARKS